VPVMPRTVREKAADTRWYPALREPVCGVAQPFWLMSYSTRWLPLSFWYCAIAPKLAAEWVCASTVWSEVDDSPERSSSPKPFLRTARATAPRMMPVWPGY